MSLGLGMLGVIFAIASVTIAAGVCIVPQGYNYVVEHFGKYSRTLKPGLNFIIPYIESISAKITTKDIVLDIPSQEVITSDNAVIMTNAISFISINNPAKAIYGIEDFKYAMQQLVQTSLRSIVGEMKLDDALSSREIIKAKLKDAISDDISDWGITLKNVEIQDIKPSNSMQKSMEEQAAAERERRAAITRAEGEKKASILEAEGLKRSQILEAEGRKEAAILDAEAQVTLSESSQVAISNVTKAIENNELPAMFMLGEKYIGAMENLAGSDNSKMVFVPSDILASVNGLLGKK